MDLMTRKGEGEKGEERDKGLARVLVSVPCSASSSLTGLCAVRVLLWGRLLLLLAGGPVGVCGLVMVGVVGEDDVEDFDGGGGGGGGLSSECLGDSFRRVWRVAYWLLVSAVTVAVVTVAVRGLLVAAATTPSTSAVATMGAASEPLALLVVLPLSTTLVAAVATRPTNKRAKGRSSSLLLLTSLSLFTLPLLPSFAAELSPPLLFVVPPNRTDPYKRKASA